MMLVSVNMHSEFLHFDILFTEQVKSLSIKIPPQYSNHKFYFLFFHSICISLSCLHLIHLLQFSHSCFPFWVSKECLSIAVWRGTYATAHYEKTCQHCSTLREGLTFAQMQNNNGTPLSILPGLLNISSLDIKII